jgi:hypothetical protein
LRYYKAIKIKKLQFNIITKLQSSISTIYKSNSDEIVIQFDNAKNKIIETSDDPKKDGEKKLNSL